MSLHPYTFRPMSMHPDSSTTHLHLWPHPSNNRSCGSSRLQTSPSSHRRPNHSDLDGTWDSFSFDSLIENGVSLMAFCSTTSFHLDGRRSLPCAYRHWSR